MTPFKKGLSLTLAVLFVPLTLVALLAFNLERTVFDAETYRQVLANQRFYDRLPPILAQTLSGSNALEGLPAAMQGLNDQQWENFIRDLLSPEALQAMGNETLTSLFAYLNGEGEAVQMPLTPLKQSMTADAGTQAVLAVFRAQPDCTLAQLAQMTMSAFGNGQLVLCNLPEELYPVITPIIQAQLQGAAAALPEQVTLFGGERFQNARQRLQTIRLAMRLSPLVPLTFLFALTLLTVRSLRDWLAWWGGPFLAAGLLTLLSALAGAPVFGAILFQVMERHLPALLTPAMLDQARPLVIVVMEQFTQPLKLQGLVLACVGLFMTLAALALQRKRHKTP